MRVSWLAVVVLLALCGCADNKPHQENHDRQTPTINTNPYATVPVAVPPPSSDAPMKAAVHTEMIAASQTLNDQLSGLINIGLGKIGEKVTGIEKLVDAKLEMINKISVDLKNEFMAKIEAQLKVNTDLQVQNEANLKLINDMRVTIEGMKVKLEAQALAQVGYQNRIDQLSVSASSGRDTNQNFFPKEAVDVIDRNAEIYAGVITAILGLFSSVMILSFRASRQREALRAQADREERNRANQMLLEVLAMLPHENAKAIQERLDHLRQQPSSSA